MEKTNKMKCCICGKEFEGFGHNEEPINNGRCCDQCNYNAVLSVRISKLGMTITRQAKVGDKIRIIEMVDEPNYNGREGVVEHIDSIGQLHGTWGGCGILPDIDTYIIIE